MFSGRESNIYYRLMIRKIRTEIGVHPARKILSNYQCMNTFAIVRWSSEHLSYENVALQEERDGSTPTRGDTHHPESVLREQRHFEKAEGRTTKMATGRRRLHAEKPPIVTRRLCVCVQRLFPDSDPRLSRKQWADWLRDLPRAMSLQNILGVKRDDTSPDANPSRNDSFLRAFHADLPISISVYR